MAPAPVDPYRDWLGIADPRRPPTCYALLGFERGHLDSAGLERAFYDRYARVRRYQVGRHSDQAVQVLDELAHAYRVLSDPAAREAYDRSLTSAAIPGTPVNGNDWEGELPEAELPEAELVVTDEQRLQESEEQIVSREGRQGLLQFARRVLKSGTKHEPLHRVLVEEARRQQQYVCNACFGLFAHDEQLGTSRVAVTSREDVVSEILTVSVTTSLLFHDATIAGLPGSWEQDPTVACLHRGGVVWLSAALWTPLVIAFGLLQGQSLAEIVGLLAASAVFASAMTYAATRLYRPRFHSGLDVAWELVVPAWLAGARPEQVEFIASLAKLSVGRGTRRCRQAALDQLADVLDSWLSAAKVNRAQVAALARLIMLDRLRDPRQSAKAVQLLVRLTTSILRGEGPVTLLDQILDEGKLLALAGPEDLAVLRVRLFQAFFEARLTAADIQKLMAVSASLTRLLPTSYVSAPVPAARQVAMYLALLRRPPRALQLALLDSIYERVTSGKVKGLGRSANQLLLISPDGAVQVTLEGIFFQGERLPPKQQIGWRTSNSWDRSSRFVIMFGRRTIPWQEHPQVILGSLELLRDWWEHTFQKEVARQLELPPSQVLTAATFYALTACPHCARDVRLLPARYEALPVE